MEKENNAKVVVEGMIFDLEMMTKGEESRRSKCIKLVWRLGREG